MVLVELRSSGHGACCGTGRGDPGWVRPLYVQRHVSFGCLTGNEPDSAPLWHNLNKPRRAPASQSVNPAHRPWTSQFWTSLYGEFVGEDEFGNRYFRTRGGKIDPNLGFERRWVIYNGVAEASTVPPSWHGWLHHTVNVPPTEEKVVPRPWWKPHRANMTGTPGAHRPTGSTLAQGRRPKATGDYKAWTPGR
jgi:NADH:ubiquinone oxidoreductase subunit